MYFSRQCESILLACWLAIPSLTLGAHAQEGYSSCPVCLSVCLSIDNIYSVTGVYIIYGLSVCYDFFGYIVREFRYVQVYYRLFLIFNSWIFDKPFRSEVMA